VHDLRYSDVRRRLELVGQELGRLVGRDQRVELAVLPVADETATARILRQAVGPTEAAADFFEVRGIQVEQVVISEAEVGEQEVVRVIEEYELAPERSSRPRGR
jgi:hypothetical protein